MLAGTSSSDIRCLRLSCAIGVASFLPIFFYTFFLFLFTSNDLADALPRSIRNIAKLSLILFLPAIIVFNEIASFVGVKIGKPSLNSPPNMRLGNRPQVQYFPHKRIQVRVSLPASRTPMKSYSGHSSPARRSHCSLYIKLRFSAFHFFVSRGQLSTSGGSRKKVQTKLISSTEWAGYALLSSSAHWSR